MAAFANNDIKNGILVTLQMVIILFGGAMIAFFCRSPQIFSGWGDEVIKYFGREKDMKLYVFNFIYILYILLTTCISIRFTIKAVTFPTKNHKIINNRR